MSLASTRWRVVVDTNVLVSGLLFGGKPEAILDLALDRAFLLLTSPAMESELIRVLTRKFDISSAGVTGIIALIRSSSESVHTGTKLKLCRDESDNRVLECALEGGASYIVTGDRDLLSLPPFQYSVILRPDEFLTRFYAAHPGL
ncbi:MAG: putative toxin-antitoxin system toxin component, PIN family [Terracidiphilus sp.]|jgi:putative PIN family toxin of toxin-antitoxin system